MKNTPEESCPFWEKLTTLLCVVILLVSFLGGASKQKKQGVDTCVETLYFSEPSFRNKMGGTENIPRSEGVKL